MPLEITELEKHLIYNAFTKHVNLSPTELQERLPAESMCHAVIERQKEQNAQRRQDHSKPASDEIGQPTAEGEAPAGMIEESGVALDEQVDQPELEFEMTEQEAQVLPLVLIKRKRKDELTDEDFSHMRRAVNAIRRLQKHPPKNEENRPNWLARMADWGYDPIKEEEKAREKANRPFPIRDEDDLLADLELPAEASSKD